MARFIYNVMATTRKGIGGKYKDKLFQFTNQQEAKRAFNSLAKELRVITGKKPNIQNLNGKPYVAYVGSENYYSISFSKTLVNKSTDKDINFNFNNEDEK